MIAIFVLEEAFKAMERHALSAYPEECCGLLIGDLEPDFGNPDGEIRVWEVRRLNNAWEGQDRTRRYLADPDGIARVEKEFAGKPRGIVGIYHSHPDAPAWPSPFDLARAWPFYAYLILSVEKKKPAECRAWRLGPDARSFEEQKLKRGG